MICTEKTELYNKLVTDIQACPKLSDCNNSKSPKAIQLEKCPFCNEVNLWSYWQGGINNLDADILLVGQDWGNFDDKNYNEIIRSITASEDDSNSTTHYPYEKNPTDKNLCRLFDVLGDSFNIKEYNNPKVFFSNFVLCYRKNTRISGGFRQRWARNCSEYFLRLVSIIQPKVIICLGRSVFDAVIKALNLFEDDESQKNAKNTLAHIRDLKNGNGTATLILLDPFGQSNIVSDSVKVSEIPEEELHGLKTGFSVIEDN